MSQASLSVLQERAFNNYMWRLESFDPQAESTLEIFRGKSYAFTLRDANVEAFKKMIKMTQDEGKKKVWKTFGAIKSELINHW